MNITDYLRDTAHAIDIGESAEAAFHAKKLREAADTIGALEADLVKSERRWLSLAQGVKQL